MFTTIQAAVDAAVSGDVVVVQPGQYSQFNLIGKGVSIIGDIGSQDIVVIGEANQTTTTVTGVPAGERALVQGIRFRSPPEPFSPPISGPTLSVRGNPGVVVLENLDIDATQGLSLSFSGFSQNEALNIENSANVVVVNSSVLGASGSAVGGQEFGARGMTVEGSRAFVHGCQILPGGTSVEGGTGREAVYVRDGDLVLRDSALFGGRGGSGCTEFAFVDPCLSGSTFPPGNGGPALFVDFNATVTAIGTDLIPGPSGIDASTGQPSASPGSPFMGSGIVVEQAARATLLETTSLVRDDDPVQAAVELNLVSEPDSVVAMFLDLETTPAFAPGLPGFLAFGLGSIVLSGATDAAGEYELMIDIPSFPPELQKLDLTAQGVVLVAPDGLEFSNPSIFTVINR